MALPVVVLVLWAGFQVGRLLVLDLGVWRAEHAALQAAAVDGGWDARAAAVLERSLGQMGIGSSDVTVAATGPDQPFGDPVRLTVSVHLAVHWQPLAPPTVVTLTATGEEPSQWNAGGW